MLHALSCFLVLLSCFITLVFHCFSHVLLLLWFATPMFYYFLLFHYSCVTLLLCFVALMFYYLLLCYSYAMLLYVSLLMCFVTLMCFRYLFAPCCFIVPLCFVALVLHCSCVLLRIVFCCSLSHISITPLYIFEFFGTLCKGFGVLKLQQIFFKHRTWCKGFVYWGFDDEAWEEAWKQQIPS